jgi:hypothetical protein
MPPKTNLCSQILTPLYSGSTPICWFMSTFVAMFYSQRSRKIILEASKKWNKRDPLFKSLKNILVDKYIKVAKGESDEYKSFTEKTFLDLLTLLFEKNKKKFSYDHRQVKSPYMTKFYIGKLYKLLGVNYKVFDYIEQKDLLAYSYINEEYDILTHLISNGALKSVIDDEKIKEAEKLGKYVDDMIAPDILIIHNDETFYLNGNVITNVITKGHLTAMTETIYYNESEYHLDSVLLGNWNIEAITGHLITGMTCKKKKYVYNGWNKTTLKNPDVSGFALTNRSFPCGLMDYDWDVKKSENFCLNTTTCALDILKPDFLTLGRQIYNFNKGPRFLIYVRTDTKKKTSSMKDTDLDNFFEAQRLKKVAKLQKDMERITKLLAKLTIQPPKAKKRRASSNDAKEKIKIKKRHKLL